MDNITVVGIQWGDEGKGKIVDWLSEEADVVVRFQGGHNAGHTLVIDGEVYKLSLLPSGIVRKGKISVIGNGVVIDPTALFKEIESIQKQGVEITPDNLYIAENASLILPIHSQIDAIAEDYLAGNKIGTTGRGIGPAYEDKIGRRAIRVCDLADLDTLKIRIENLLTHHNALRRGFGADEVNGDELFAYLEEIAAKLLPFARPVWKDLHAFEQQGKKILFEGAQGIMLDVDHGTYPFVTSSNTVADNAFVGTGLGTADSTVLGIVKAYTTRVGSGPFPTEQDNAIGQKLGERGHEFGTVTGRERRCGWFDGVMVRQSLRISGTDEIALTKLDVLDGFEELKICTGYKYQGETYDYLPASIAAQKEVEPIYQTYAGWSEETVGTDTFAELPKNAQIYIKAIEEFCGVPIKIISTSPERKDTIRV